MNREEKWLLLEKYQGIESEEFYKDLEKLKAGYPLAYLIGNIPFLNLTIALDSRPLIPRTETEYWVDFVLKKLNAQSESDKKAYKILDLCSGSGAIGLAFYKNISTEILVLNEIDNNHHRTIEKNISINNLDSTKIQVIGGDLYENVTAGQKFDIILANPPYIYSGLASVDENVLNYEPKLALDGGIDGLDFIRKIIQQSKQWLEINGILVIEHDPWQSDKITQIAHSFGYKVSIFPDQFKNLRFSILEIIN